MLQTAEQRRIAVLLLLCSSFSAGLRIKREDENDLFSWDSDAVNDSSSSTVPELNGRQLDPAVLSEILANGPEDAGKISPHPDKCVCVPYYLCKEGGIITDGAGIIDVRVALNRTKAKRSSNLEDDASISTKAYVGGNCPGITEVCCTAPQKNPVPEIVPPEVIGDKYISQCGVRNNEGLLFRITNFKDNEAQYGEFPWMLAILRPQVSAATGALRDVYQCGGSLIHPLVVLTAAHCISGKDPKTLKVRIGEWDTQSNYEFFQHQDRAVIDAVIHEDFYAPALFNDVALLFLDKPVDLGPEADTICLPRADDTFDGSRCLATGWGKDQFGQVGKYQHILKKIELPIVPHEPCQASLRKTRLGSPFKLHPSFVCAGGEPGKDTCKGDGGSPLVCPIPGTSKPKRYVQVGIVAWGIGCGENGVPGVYVNVPRLVPWIEKKIVERLVLPLDHFEKQYPMH